MIVHIYKALDDKYFSVEFEDTYGSVVDMGPTRYKTYQGVKNGLSRIFPQRTDCAKITFVLRRTLN